MPITPAQIPVTPGSGLILDAVQVTVNSTAVDRETVVLADPLTPGNYANVTAVGALQVDGSGVTQPISGTVTANVGTGTQPVSGTVAVSNFPATQPISGSVTATQATGTNLHTVVDSGTITAVTAITNALPTGANTIGKVDILGNAGGILDTVKGTQSATAVGVQELKDAGRKYVTLVADSVTPATSETVLTFAKNIAGTVTSGVTTYQVTSGKTLRIQAITATLMQSSTTVVACKLHLRHNTAGAAIATSPLVAMWQLGTPATAAVGNTGIAPQDVSIPDGLEIPQNGTDNITFSAIATSAAGTLSVTLIGYEY